MRRVAALEHDPHRGTLRRRGHVNGAPQSTQSYLIQPRASRSTSGGFGFGSGRPHVGHAGRFTIAAT
jgi:hypothetical protein